MSLEDSLGGILAKLQTLKRTDTPTQPQEIPSKKTAMCVGDTWGTTPTTPILTPAPVGNVGVVGAPSVVPMTQRNNVQDSAKPPSVGVSVQSGDKTKLQVLLTLAAQAGYPQYGVNNHWVFIPAGKEAWQRNLQAMLKSHPQDLPRVLAFLEADQRLMQAGTEPNH